MMRNLQWLADVLLLVMVACGGGGVPRLPVVLPDVVETVVPDVVEAAVDMTAPTAPSQLKAKANSLTSVILTWDGSTDDVGVMGYKVFDKGTEIGSVTTTTFRHDGLIVDSEHCYRVQAFDMAGNVSELSNEACVTLNTCSSGYHDGGDGTCVLDDDYAVLVQWELSPLGALNLKSSGYKMSCVLDTSFGGWSLQSTGYKLTAGFEP